ncbi:exosortase-associated EpsI family protein [Phragmitibacter flavus]|uniref:Exosortase-associated EpsI family protein n=1 Tax=Phragmitibacter flavus TaxID=2576071 RepID=A0A5R8KF18_9BACT|nr:exosortase-associated EpsI family protein [Phragmitibacter flavus]TLD70890.1 exosortase-associated EpsI family protein [Phragmitibacter flavus]
MLLRSLILSFILIGTMVVCWNSPPIKAGDGSGVIMDLPKTLSGLISVPEDPDAIELEQLPSDTQITKRLYYTPTHRSEARDHVRSSIILSGAERKSIHRPEICLVAQGWKLVSSRIRTVRINDQHDLEVTDLYIERKVTLKSGEVRPLRSHYVYWFIGTDITTASHSSRAIISLMDSILRNVNHRWAYASVQANVTDNLPTEEFGERQRDSEQTVELILKVLAESVPHFQKQFAQN